MKNIFKKFLCAAVVGVSCVLAANATVHEVTITPREPLDSQQWNSVDVNQRLYVEGRVLLYIRDIVRDRMGRITAIQVLYDDEAQNAPRYLKCCCRRNASIQNGDLNVNANWNDMGQTSHFEGWLRLLTRQINNPPAASIATPTVKFDPAGEAVQAGRKVLRRLQIMMTPLGI